MHTFEKLGYCTDPYLGHLTVSPKYLGTAFHFEADMKFQARIVSSLERHLIEKMEVLRNLKVEYKDHVTNEVCIKTKQTLAPNYNETVQILDFLDTLAELSKLDVE